VESLRTWWALKENADGRQPKKEGQNERGKRGREGKRKVPITFEPSCERIVRTGLKRGSQNLNRQKRRFCIKVYAERDKVVRVTCLKARMKKGRPHYSKGTRRWELGGLFYKRGYCGEGAIIVLR